VRTTGRRRYARVALIVTAAAVPVLLVAGSAAAHVTVSADDATQGGYAKVTFRVPNETDDADTTKVAVFFPQSQPLAEVSVQAQPGWSYQVRTTKLANPITSDDGQVSEAVSEVVWTADSKATGIKPGEFDEFDVSAGPLATSPTMVFKALQTYSDGTVVRWIDETPAGGPEPEHPAPTLTLAATGSDGTGTTSSGGSGKATTALVLSVVALLVALGAVASSFLRRSRA
jgi:uncharacterized protein YcnI